MNEQTIMTKIQDLAEDYKNRKKSLSEKDKAFLEQIIWKETIGSKIRKEKERAEFLKELLGGTNREYYERAALLNAGDNAEALWTQVAKHGMPVSTAVRLYRNAKTKAFRQCVSISPILEGVLAEYMELSPTYLPSGKVIRRKSTSRLPSIDELDKNGKLKTSKSSREPKRFRTKLRSALAPILAVEFEGVEQIVAEKLWRELEIEINSLLDDFKSKIYRAKQDVKRGHVAVQKLSFHKIIEACNVLVMDPPATFGEKIDMHLAGRRKRELVKLYHPDANNGDHSLRQKYQSVLQAHTILQQYSESLDKGTGS